jgi:RecA-family ATPase
MNSRTQENVREVRHAMGDVDGGRPIVVNLADVEARITEYLWPSRVPLSKLAIIIGDPGVGKSTLALDIAARVSTGAAWPDGGVAPISDVVLLSAEDALDDTIRPRLDRLGADVTKIHALIGIRDAGDQRLPNLARDVELLERVVLDRSARLVIIDPVSAYLGKTDSHRDAEVRGVLGPIAAMADRTGAAVLGVMHLNKSSQGPALYRAIGSIAFVAAARLVLAVAPHPEDPELRIVVPMKSNIC